MWEPGASGSTSGMGQFHGTTILAVRRGKSVAMGGDGQASHGPTIMKAGVRKIRRLKGGQLVGYAGSTADAFSLVELFENKLEQHKNNLKRAAVELAKDWRTDRILRRLEAMLLVADAESLLLITGQGDVVEPEEETNGKKSIGMCCAIGSGGSFALSAARALMKHTKLSAKEIVEAGMAEAAEICVYTNDRLHIEEIS